MTGGFIDGIYNYCDRWCERCPLTARCRVFAIEDALHRGDDYNAAFWRAFDDVAEKTSGELAEEYLGDTGESEDEKYLPEEDDTDDDDDALILKRDRDPLAKMAMEYGMQVHQWLRSQPDPGKTVPGQQPDPDFSGGQFQRNDALEILNWYCLQIGVKLARATRGASRFEAETRFDDADVDDEIREAMIEAAQTNRDGSAKVALIGIERSLGAWTILRDHFPEHQQLFRGYLRQLARLRRQIDERFPGARTFQRAGFEYDV